MHTIIAEKNIFKSQKSMLHREHKIRHTRALRKKLLVHERALKKCLPVPNNFLPSSSLLKSQMIHK